MEEGLLGKGVGLRLQPSALFVQSLPKVIERSKTLVGDRGIGQVPQALGRLQLRRVRGQVDGFDSQRVSLLSIVVNGLAWASHSSGT